MNPATATGALAYLNAVLVLVVVGAGLVARCKGDEP